MFARGIWQAEYYPPTSRFALLLSVAKASREMVALVSRVLAGQERLDYGTMVTPTPSRVRVHSVPPSFLDGNETHTPR